MDEGLDRIIWDDDVDALSHYPNLELYKDHALFLCISRMAHKCMPYLMSCGAKLVERCDLNDILYFTQCRGYCMELVQMCIDTGVLVNTTTLRDACHWKSVELASLLLRNYSSPKDTLSFYPRDLNYGYRIPPPLSVPKLFIEHGFEVRTCQYVIDPVPDDAYIANVRNALAQHNLLCRRLKKECTHIVWCLQQQGVSKWIIKDMLMYIWEIKMKPHRDI